MANLRPNLTLGHSQIRSNRQHHLDIINGVLRKQCSVFFFALFLVCVACVCILRVFLAFPVVLVIIILILSFV